MIIHEPAVFLIGVPQADRAQIDKLMAHLGHVTDFSNHHRSPDQIIATGSRGCYNSYARGRDPSSHLRHVIEEGHGSVLQHANFTVYVCGVSRSLTHEFIRHSAGFAYSELSQRYVTVEPRFVLPPLYPEELHEEWHEAQMGQYYKYLAHLKRLEADFKLSRKEAHGAARSLLPEATETRIQITGNVRAWRNVFDQRISVHADAEIRRLSRIVLDLLQHETETFDDYREDPVTGLPKTPNRKV